MNQTERNNYKYEMTKIIKGIVENASNESIKGIIDTVKGFVLVTEKGYVEVAVVIKKDTFDLEDAKAELAEKVANKIKREKERAEKKAKALAKKNLTKKTK